MVVINNKFLKYTALGQELAQKICLGYKVTTIISDRLGNGLFQFEKEGSTTVYVPFKELNVNDEVEIEYNKLGEIKREY